MSSTPVEARNGNALQRLFAVAPGEWPALLTAFGCAATLFASYAVLRPVRDAMGITSSFQSLPWLFWGTFLGMLAIQPLYGWVMGRGTRGTILPRIYLAFVAMLLGFWAWFMLQADHTWVARAYFIWVSVFNLFVVSVFWSLMADVFTREQAGRLFGMIAAGISTGGLVGPLLAATLAGCGSGSSMRGPESESRPGVCAPSQSSDAARSPPVTPAMAPMVSPAPLFIDLPLKVVRFRPGAFAPRPVP